jgi:(E)-4-hydroxy-3-methylbut-2-enyl-diphosphate synthase
MSRYGDTPMGMVESAMEFLRIARAEAFHNIVLSMKSSNPQVMVQAYRLLVSVMQDEFGEIYPLHLGVTEAGDGEEGRIKSAIGIGTLLEEGIGDTIRVSLTEDPELEIPVCKDIVKRYAARPSVQGIAKTLEKLTVPRPSQMNSEGYQRRQTFAVQNIGGHHVPSVIADLSKLPVITPADLQPVGYTYDAPTDKWHIGDTAADYIFIGSRLLDFALPGTLKVIVDAAAWIGSSDDTTYFPIYGDAEYAHAVKKSSLLNFVMVDCYTEGEPDYTLLENLGKDGTAVLCLSSQHPLPLAAVRRMFGVLAVKEIKNPAVLIVDSNWTTPDEHLIHFATESGALLLDGFGDGVSFGLTAEKHQQLSGPTQQTAVTGRHYVRNSTPEAFINHTAFAVLQATRTRISKTEYISCPSCGRTLFDLQETTAKIRAVTDHLKGVKIAIMGCIVNGPGEMADADFGYVGSGVGKITLYRSKEVVKRNVPSEVAVDELINLMKESGAWVEKEAKA